MYYWNWLEITFDFLKKFKNWLRNEVTNQFSSKLDL